MSESEFVRQQAAVKDEGAGQAAPRPTRGLWAGLAASLGAFACCGAALVLASLGVGGSVVAGLKAMAPLRPLFILLALAAFGWAWWRLYRAAPGCTAAGECPPTLRRQRRLFWILAGMGALLMAFPWYAPLFMK